jgi:hypothetical protein
MHCSYCGKSFLLASRIFHDPDFCRPSHRWKFHKRLGVAVRLIRRTDELHPAGLAGFRELTAAHDLQYEFSVGAPGWHARATNAPAFRLVAIIGEELAFESVADTTIHPLEPETRANQPDRRTRLRGVRDLVTQLRRDVERRRQEIPANSGDVLAPVIEFKPSAHNATALQPSTAVELPLAIRVG